MAKPDFEELIRRAVESDELDYKAHQSWNTMTRAAKAKIVRHLAAFANTRGGYLVIGVGEDDSGYPGVLQGVSDEESASFDPSKVGAFVKNYVEPQIDFTIERPVVDGKRFVVFVIKPFSVMPHVCCQAVEHELREGVFYIRTADASSRPATRAIELHQLIQRALRNQREMLGRMLRGILYETNTSTSVSEEPGVIEQIRSAIGYFVRRREPADSGKYMLVQLTAVPDGECDYTLSSMRTLFENEPVSGILKDVFNCGSPQVHETNVGMRYLAADERRMWQLFKNGSFLYTGYLMCGEDGIPVDSLFQIVLGSILFSSAVAAAFAQEERLYSVRLAVSGGIDVKIVLDDKRKLSVASTGTTAEICRSAADLASAPEVHAGRVMRKFIAGFEENI